jgi:hypothetical protein
MMTKYERATGLDIHRETRLAKSTFELQRLTPEGFTPRARVSTPTGTVFALIKGMTVTERQTGLVMLILDKQASKLVFMADSWIRPPDPLTTRRSGRRLDRRPRKHPDPEALMVSVVTADEMLCRLMPYELDQHLVIWKDSNDTSDEVEAGAYESDLLNGAQLALRSVRDRTR